MSPEPFAAITQRDRPLPDRRDPDLDPRRPAVEVARGGPDRPGQGDHRQAGRALRGRHGEARPRRAAGRRLMESASIAGSGRAAPTSTSTTARPRPTRARGSTARRSGSCSSSSRRSCCSGRSSPRTSSSAWSPTRAPGRPRASSSRSRSPASTPRSWSPRASPSTGRWRAIRKGNRRGLQMGLAMTWLLGATFLFIQINEYIHIGFSARDGAFGSIFYGLTGLHGAHVFVGLVLLTLRQHPRLARPLRPRGQGPPRRRGAGHLLALRRRHVDHRLHGRLHPLARP